MKTIIRLGILLVILSVSGCEKKAVWEPNPGFVAQVVIHALLTDEPGRQEITIAQTIIRPGDVPTPLTGAIVYLSDEDTVYTLVNDSTQPGTYVANLTLEPGTTYTLIVSLNTAVYSARATLTDGMAFDPPVFAFNGSDSLYYLERMGSPFDPDFPAMYRITADWSNVAGYLNQPASACRAEFYAFSLPTLDVGQLLPPSAQKTGVPPGSLINVERYALDAAHAEYYRQVLLETSWSGGLFAVDPANVPTNFTGGAKGYFGLCGLTRLSLAL